MDESTGDDRAGGRNWTIDPMAVQAHRRRIAELGENAGFSVDRRSFLTLAAAGSAVTGASAETLSARLRFVKTADGVAILLGETTVWAAALDWMVDRDVRVAADQGHSVAISGRVPASPWTIRITLTLISSRPEPQLEIRHSCWTRPCTVELFSWLDGRAIASGLTQALGTLLNRPDLLVGHIAEATLRLQPDLGVDIDGLGTVSLSGGRVGGSASRLRIGPAHDQLMRRDASSESTTVAHLTVYSSDNTALKVAPPTGLPLVIDSFSARQVIFELAETKSGRRAVGFLAHANVPLNFSQTSERDMLRANVTLHNVTYVEQGRAISLVADRTSTVVRAHDAVIVGTSLPDISTCVSLSGGRASIACALVWDDISIVHPDGVTLRLSALTKASSTEQSITDLLEDAPWLPRRLCLDHMQLEALRPEDGLWLRLRFRDAMLVRSLRGYRLKFRPGNGRMWVILPPQAVQEEAFFRAPEQWPQPPAPAPPVDDKPPKDEYGIPFASTPNELRKSLQETGNPAQIEERRRVRLGLDSSFPADRRARARTSADTALVLTPKASDASYRLSLDELLDPQQWTLAVADNAYSSLNAWRKAHGGYPADVTKAGLAEVTHIEMPRDLHISPDERAELTHAPLTQVKRSRFQPLFYLGTGIRDQSTPGERIARYFPATPFRAIHADAATLPLPAHDLSADQLYSLDARDLGELVWLSGRWGRAGLFGSKNVRPADGCQPSDKDFGVHDPQAFQVERLRLTAFGGGMDAQGSWDPPYLQDRDPCLPQTGSIKFPLSIEQWTHRSSLARTHYERVQYRGWLLPFGFRASLVKLTEREVADWDCHPTAMEAQRYFIQVAEPVLRFPLPGQPTESQNAFCQPETFELLLPDGVEIDHPNNSSIDGLGMSGFWVKANGAPVQFKVRIGGQGIATCSMVFVDNLTTHDPTSLKKVRLAYNGSAARTRTMSVPGTPVCFAPPTKHGDTSFPTESMVLNVTVNEQLINSTLLEAAKQPPVYPLINSARIVVRSIRTQTSGAVDPVQVGYHSTYVGGGFDPASNPAEVFLELTSTVKLSFGGKTERSGAIANPDMEAKHLSRSKGLLSEAMLPSPAKQPALALVAAAETKQLFTSEARLFGMVDLNKLLEGMGVGELPALIEETQYRFHKATDQVDEEVRQFVREARVVVNDLKTTWEDGSAEGELAEWQSSELYKLIQVPLSQLDTDVQGLEGALGKPAVEVWAAMAEVGKDIVSLRDAFDELARRPEITIGPLLNSGGIGALLHWFRGVKASWVNGVEQQISDLVAEAYKVRNCLRELAENGFEQIAQLERVAAEETESARTAVRTVQAVVAQVERKDPQQLLRQLFGLLETYSPLYELRQSLVDEAARALTLGAVATEFVEALAEWAGALKDYPVRNAVLAGFHAWANAIKQTLGEQQPSDAVKEALRAFETSKESLEALLDDIVDYESQQGTVADDAFLRIADRFFRLTQDIEQTFGRIANLPSEVLATAQRASCRAACLAWTAFVGCQAEEEVRRDARGAPVRPMAQRPDFCEAACPAEPPLERRAMRAAGGTPPVLLCDVAVRPAWLRLAAAARALATALGASARPLRGPGTAVAAPMRSQYAALLDDLAAAAAQIAADLSADRVPTPAILGSLLRVTARLRSVFGCLSAPTSPACLSQWPGYDTAMASMDGLLAVARTAVDKALDLFLQGADSAVEAAGKSELAKSILGPNFTGAFEDVKAAIQSFKRVTGHAPADWIKLAGIFTDELIPRWNALLLQLDQTQIYSRLSAQLVDQMREKLLKIASQFVPARIQTEYTLEKSSEYSNVLFKSGTKDGEKCHLLLKTRFGADLLAGTAVYSLEGELCSFRLVCFNLITLPVTRLRFTGSSQGGFHMDPPEFGIPRLEGPFNFLAELLKLLSDNGGLFVGPSPTNIRVGYRFGRNLIQTGGMTLQNFSFEVAARIPFSNGKLSMSVACGRPDAPVLMSVGIYGGGFHLLLESDGTEIKRVDIALMGGLVGAFNFSVIRGSGRATIFLRYYMEGTVTTTGGFYVGGHATVLGIVSLSVELEFKISVTEGRASGSGRFSVTVGVGFFSFTLRYSLGYSQGSKAAPAPQQIAAKGAAPCIAAALPSNLDPVNELLAEWDTYINAFARITP